MAESKLLIQGGQPRNPIYDPLDPDHFPIHWQVMWIEQDWLTPGAPMFNQAHNVNTIAFLQRQSVFLNQRSSYQTDPAAQPIELNYAYTSGLATCIVVAIFGNQNNEAYIAHIDHKTTINWATIFANFNASDQYEIKIAYPKNQSRETPSKYITTSITLYEVLMSLYTYCQESETPVDITAKQELDITNPVFQRIAIDFKNRNLLPVFQDDLDFYFPNGNPNFQIQCDVTLYDVEEAPNNTLRLIYAGNNPPPNAFDIVTSDGFREFFQPHINNQQQFILHFMNWMQTKYHVAPTYCAEHRREIQGTAARIFNSIREQRQVLGFADPAAVQDEDREAPEQYGDPRHHERVADEGAAGAGAAAQLNAFRG